MFLFFAVVALAIVAVVVAAVVLDGVNVAVVVDPKVHQRNKKSAQVNAPSVSEKRMNHVESFHFTNCQNFAACASRQNSKASSVVISFTICNQTRVHCFFNFHPKL